MYKKSDKRILLDAIREHCVDCMCDHEFVEHDEDTRIIASVRVNLCPITCCPLHKFRYGTMQPSIIAEI